MQTLALTGQITHSTADTVRRRITEVLDALRPSAVLLAGDAMINQLGLRACRAAGVPVAGLVPTGPDGLEELLAQMDVMVQIAPQETRETPDAGGRARAVQEALGKPAMVIDPEVAWAA